MGFSLMKRRLVVGIFIAVITITFGFVAIWVYRVTQFDPAKLSYFSEGQADAKNDLKNGKMVYKIAGLGFQEEEICKLILLRDYEIELERVAGCEIEEKLGDYKDGYNEVMIEAIEKRYGNDIFDKAFEQAHE